MKNTQLKLKLEAAGFKAPVKRKSRYQLSVEKCEAKCRVVFNDSLKYYQNLYKDSATVYAAMSCSLEQLGRHPFYMKGRFVWGSMLKKLEVN